MTPGHIVVWKHRGPDETPVTAYLDKAGEWSPNAVDAKVFDTFRQAINAGGRIFGTTIVPCWTA